MDIEEIKRLGGSWLMTERLVKKISSMTEEILKHYHKRNFSHDYQRVLFEFIQRIHINYSAIATISKIYLAIPKFRFAIFTLIRPLLSDFIIQIHLIEPLTSDNEMGTNQKDFMNRYSELSNQFYHKFDKLLESQIAANIVSSSERNDYFTQEKTYHPEHFDNKGSVKKMTKNQLQPKNIIEEIKKGKFKDLANVYDSYFFLSQFDHFSEKTEELMQSDIKLDQQIISECSDYILRGLILNLSFMDKDSPFIERLLKIKEEEIEQ